MNDDNVKPIHPEQTELIEPTIAEVVSASMQRLQQAAQVLQQQQQVFEQARAEYINSLERFYADTVKGEVVTDG